MRRSVVTFMAACLALQAPALACGPESGRPAPLAAAQSIEIPGREGRKVLLSVWRTTTVPERGVVIFGHGMGGEPLAYRPFLEALVGAGYDVVAPLAVDSLSHPDRAKYDLPKGFGARVEDLMVARGYAAKAFPGQPQVLAGHSYGSLFAMIGAGAKSPAGALSGPPVAAVLALSTPGKIPGLVADDAFATLNTPLMIVTGTKDVVPGFVANPADHRFAFDTAPKGNKVLLTVPGGDHDLMIRGDSYVREKLTSRILDWLSYQTARKDVAPLPVKACEWGKDHPAPYKEESR